MLKSTCASEVQCGSICIQIRTRMGISMLLWIPVLICNCAEIRMRIMHISPEMEKGWALPCSLLCFLVGTRGVGGCVLSVQ